MKRSWLFKVGSGRKQVMVLPRKDGKEVSTAEWEGLHHILGEEFSLIIIDIPEYICIYGKSYERYTTDIMADVLNNIIIERGLVDVSAIIGVSLGGMIAQKFVDRYKKLPVIFISTVISQNPKLTTVFYTWKNNLILLGEEVFNINLLPGFYLILS